MNDGSSGDCMVRIWTSSTVTPTYASSPWSFTVLSGTTLTLFPLPEVLHFDTGMVGSSTMTALCHGSLFWHSRQPDGLGVKQLPVWPSPGAAPGWSDLLEVPELAWSRFRQLSAQSALSPIIANRIKSQYQCKVFPCHITTAL